MYVRPIDAARDAARTTIATVYEDLFIQIDIVLAEGRAFVAAQQCDPTDKAAIAKLLLLVRMLNHLEAVSRLAEFGFETEALVLYRSMLEAFLRVAAICLTPTSVEDYWAQYLLQRQRLMTDLIEYLKTNPTAAPITLAEAQAELATVNADIANVEKAKGSKVAAVSAYKWAEWAHAKDLFFLKYAVGSMPVHHAPQELLRHMKLSDDESTVVGLLMGPEARDLKTLLLDSADLVSRAFSVVEQSLGLTRSKNFAAASKVIRDMYSTFPDGAINWETGDIQ